MSQPQLCLHTLRFSPLTLPPDTSRNLDLCRSAAASRTLLASVPVPGKGRRGRFGAADPPHSSCCLSPSFPSLAELPRSAETQRSCPHCPRPGCPTNLASVWHGSREYSLDWDCSGRCYATRSEPRKRSKCLTKCSGPGPGAGGGVLGAALGGGLLGVVEECCAKTADENSIPAATTRLESRIKHLLPTAGDIALLRHRRSGHRNASAEPGKRG